MANSKIEWTETSWNPITGCTKISPGCENCYAEKMSFRLQSMGTEKYINGFNLTLHEELINLPLQWSKPQLIFVNSMSDLFHEDVPVEFIQKVFSTISNAYWHQFQVLTKRSKRLKELNSQLIWPSNLWMGVSVENQDFTNRIGHLQKTNAKIKFISFEPLLGPIIDYSLVGIDWVIVGGESGPNARKMDLDWVTSIRDRCLINEIPFFFKQWGGNNKKKNGRILQNKIWDQMPNNITHNVIG